MEFKEKFIGFVDILGFKKMVETAESGAGMPLPELLHLLKLLGKPEDQERFRKYGPTLCPYSMHLQRDLDFRVTQISDCVVVSAEISPAGVINLVSHCFGAVIRLMTKGIMCRGYITKGLIYHTDSQVIGSGYQKAYDQEANVSAFKRKADEKGTPFVEVDQSVCDYVRDYGDKCVKEMFARQVKGDGVVTAIFPFQRLEHSFLIAGFGVKFDPEKERRSNRNLRKWITDFKEKIEMLIDKTNPSAISKAEHYIAALDAQLEVCDSTDEMISKLAPFFSPGE